jgi:eukaryotic-like serine/threonine-protein kinase
MSATGNLDKAQQVNDLAAQTYPRAWWLQVNAGVLFDALGQNDRAIAAYREALHLDPDSSLIYADLIVSNLLGNHLDEANALANDAALKKLDSPDLREVLYLLAFLQNDSVGMEQAVTWSAGKLGIEDTILFYEAATNGYFGHFKKSREYVDRAIASANRGNKHETAAGYEAAAALQAAIFGNVGEAKRRASRALNLSKGRLPIYAATLALAVAGDTVQVQALTNKFRERFPEDTFVQFNYLPSIEGKSEITQHKSATAIDTLQKSLSYELGVYSPAAFSPSLYPIYFRGQAFISNHKGVEAVREFQKLLDHRGALQNNPIAAVAVLELGRAYSVSGDTVRARAAYQDFLTLWKDADADIPILKQAKAEYAKLQ